MHVLRCVLTLCTLLPSELSRQGVDLSVPAPLAEHAGIRNVDVLYPRCEGDGSGALCREVDGVAGGPW